MAASTLRMVATRSVGARHFWGGWHGRQDVPDNKFDYRDPVRDRLLADPGQRGLVFGGPPEPHVTLNLQYCGAALLAWGVIGWMARDFRDWDAVRGVLIGTAVGDVVLTVLNLWATYQGLLNSLSWTSTIVSVLLLLGALYCPPATSIPPRRRRSSRPAAARRGTLRCARHTCRRAR